MLKKNDIRIDSITPENIDQLGIYCIRDKKSPGYTAKLSWFKQKLNAGLKIKIASNAEGKQLGFIEYTPSELAWRPIDAGNYYFIQCIALFAKESKEQGIGSALLKSCEDDARQANKLGICVMSSDGPWMANKSLFEKNEFTLAHHLDRFELMVKKIDKKAETPKFLDWTQNQKKYKGWHLIYAHQCPWHHKSITDLSAAAKQHGIKLIVKELLSPAEARQAPSGFGTFSLIKDGKLLADHYISKTRFENILKKELS